MMLIDLIENLQRCLEDNDDEDMEVRFAQQPSWPFEYSIGPDVETVDLSQEDHPSEEKKVVYLVEGSQLGYLPGVVAEAIGWR